MAVGSPDWHHSVTWDIRGPHPPSAGSEVLGKGLIVFRQAYQVILMRVQI